METYPSFYIKDDNLFSGLFSDLKSLMNLDVRLPSNPFNPSFEICGFEDFDLVFSGFWSTFQEFASFSGDSEIIVAVIDPDPVKYYKKNFGYYNWAILPTALTEREYGDFLISHPKGAEVDAILYYSETIIFTVPSQRWIVWCDRSSETCVLAARAGFDLEFWNDIDWVSDRFESESWNAFARSIKDSFAGKYAVNKVEDKNGYCPQQKNISMEFHSVASWTSSTLWDGLISNTEDILNDSFVIENDDSGVPYFEKPDRNCVGDFIIDFNGLENTRRINGKFEISGCKLEVQVAPPGTILENRNQYFKLTIPERAGDDFSKDKISELFRLIVQILWPFYAYADFEEIVEDKRLWSDSPSGWNFDTELAGVYWLTYFCRSYVEYFSKARFNKFRIVTAEPTNGFTVMLGDSPSEVSLEMRRASEVKLGELSFVGYGINKKPGQYALKRKDISPI